MLRLRLPRQFDFLSRSISDADRACYSLIDEAKISDDRDIIAKPEYREQVRVLSRQIDSLEIQIINYNEAVPKQFNIKDTQNNDYLLSDVQNWIHLQLTSPCLCVKGLNSLASAKL